MTYREVAMRAVEKPELKKYVISLKKVAVRLQKKECCKIWIGMWYDGIYKLVSKTEGAEMKYCPECKTRFKPLTGREKASKVFLRKITEHWEERIEILDDVGVTMGKKRRGKK